MADVVAQGREALRLLGALPTDASGYFAMAVVLRQSVQKGNGFAAYFTGK